MKSLLRILVLLLCFSFQLSAQTSLARKVGALTRKALKTEVWTTGQTLGQFQATLTVSQQKGLKIMLDAVAKRHILKQIGNHNFFAADLKTVMHVLNNVSNYPNKSIGEFLDDVCEFEAIARAAGDADSIAAIDNTILALMRKNSLKGGRNFNAVKGSAPEIVELVYVKGRNIDILKVQPKLSDNLAFREALCEGVYEIGDRAISGKFYLEVKNYPYYAKDRAKKTLITQVKSHFDRLQWDGELSSADPNEWPGLLYRFAKAGPQDKNFRYFKSTIERSIRSKIRALIKENLQIDDDVLLKQKVEEYMKKKVAIELV